MEGREQHSKGPSEAWTLAAPRPAPRPQSSSDAANTQPSGELSYTMGKSMSSELSCGDSRASTKPRSREGSLASTALSASSVPQLHGRISIEDWGRRGDVQHTARSSMYTARSSMHYSARSAGPYDFTDFDPSSCSDFALPEADASLCDLLAPLVAESLGAYGRVAPPSPLEVGGAFAAISAVPSASAIQGGSHFVSALRSLAQCGFRRCSLVVDKLGLSICCLEELDLGHSAEQVDFPWSSVSDVQDPRLKPGLQGCAVTVGIREPSRLFEGPCGALALVVRLPDRESAQRLADATLAFKAYEAQTMLWNVCGHGVSTESLSSLTTLLLDERGCAFWSVADDNKRGVEAAKVHTEPFVYMEQGAPPETTCCNICWC